MKITYIFLAWFLMMLTTNLTFSKNTQLVEKSRNIENAWRELKQTNSYKKLETALNDIESFSTAVDLTHSSVYQISPDTYKTYVEKKEVVHDRFLDFIKTEEWKNLMETVEKDVDKREASYEEMQKYMEILNNIQRFTNRVRNL